jgi:Fe2+ or Zn2+ uptake regulation protein/O6-methylguanine-DNA--protein-cysteine methyltransferase
VPPAFSADDIGKLLRDHGLRSTPQRRAILSVFHGGRTEHLSADDVYAQATRLLPDLSRATVYATLAEFSELGLLSAFGAPEPVRYEIKVEPHAHFRCHLCLRVFDLKGGRQDPAGITDPGFIAERVETRAEGICDECTSYGTGLDSGARLVMTSGPVTDTLTVAGVAACEIDSPIGSLLLAATPQGLTRVAFEDHGDVAALRAHAAGRRGSRAAREHLAQGREALARYFSGERPQPDCVVDWEQLTPADTALKAAETIEYASHRSYSHLGLELAPRELGRIFGGNPIPIISPCHRVSRGTEIPDTFVGGPDRRRWLDAHELAHSAV